MSPSELDDVYTHLCATMTDIGEERSRLFLARFALLAVVGMNERVAAMKLISEAREGMDELSRGVRALGK